MLAEKGVIGKAMEEPPTSQRGGIRFSGGETTSGIPDIMSCLFHNVPRDVLLPGLRRGQHGWAIDTGRLT